jgi:competence protein ComEA
MNVKRLSATAVALAFAFLASTGLVLAEAKPAPTGKVNINTATVQQLVTLPGVGEKLAARIVDYRQKSGGFKTLNELMNVQGIGEKSFAKLQPYLSAGDAAAAAKAGGSR